MEIDEYIVNQNIVWMRDIYYRHEERFLVYFDKYFEYELFDDYMVSYFDKDSHCADGWNIYVVVDDDIYESIFDNILLNEKYSVQKEITGSITIELPTQKKRWHIARREMNNLLFVQDVYSGIRNSFVHNIESQRGALLFHGACACKANKACLVVGDKGMGKSYFTNHLLFQYDWSFISADQTLVYLDNQERPIALGNIGSYRIEEKDLGFYSLFDLRVYLEKESGHKCISRKGKLNFPPVILSKYCDVQIMQDVPLKKIIIISDQECDYYGLEIEQKIEFLLRYVFNINELKKTSACDRYRHILLCLIDKCEITIVKKGFVVADLYQELY